MLVIAMSDHGQVSLTGPRLDLAARLTAAGWTTSRATLEGSEAALALANGGGIWLRDPAQVGEVVDWLLEQDWCGPVFTRDGAQGTLRHSELGMDHARAPDISLICRTVQGSNGHGCVGLSLHDAPYPEGGGCHGGLSSWELHNVLILGGGGVRRGARIEAPGGNVDILPTIMARLGLAFPAGLDGRVLQEAFQDGPDPGTVEGVPRVITSTNSRGPVTRLHVTDLGHTRYLDSAEVSV